MAEKETKQNLEELKKKIEESEKQKSEYLAGWQRARADFLNYKKEEIQRVGELVSFTHIDMVLKLLPILDNFKKANKEGLKILEKHQCERLEQSVKGFSQIENQIQIFLKGYGVEEIKAIGQKFDPIFAEAIGEVEKKNKEKGIIIEEIEKGYTLQGKVIRPAKVKVAK